MLACLFAPLRPLAVFCILVDVRTHCTPTLYPSDARSFRGCTFVSYTYDAFIRSFYVLPSLLSGVWSLLTT